MVGIFIGSGYLTNFAPPGQESTARVLLPPDKTDPGRKRAALPAVIAGEIRSGNVVDDRVRILAVQNVYRFDAHRPQIAPESEFLFHAYIQAHVVREASRVRWSHDLLLQIDHAVRIAGSILEKIAQLNSPDVGRSPTPAQKTIRSIPSQRAGLLCGIENRAEHRVKHLV